MRWWRRLQRWWLLLQIEWRSYVLISQANSQGLAPPLNVKPPPSPGPHVALVDASGADLADAVRQLLPSDLLVVPTPHPAHASDARAVTVLLHLGGGVAESDHAAAGYLSALAVAHEDADPVPVVLVLCVAASNRTDSLVGTTGDGVWVNEMSLGRWDAWRRLRTRHASDAAALANVTERLRRLLSMPTHYDALAGNSSRFLSYADRASGDQTVLVPLLASSSTPGSWHGHEMLQAALTQSVQTALAQSAASSEHTQHDSEPEAP